MRRALRWSGASLLVLLGGLLGLVGLILCVTVILAPVGIPVLFLARRLFRAASALVVPRPVRHPLQAAADAASGAMGGATDAAADAADGLHTGVRKRRKRLGRTARKARKRVARSM